jgi:ATP-binding cassette subfamily C protein LapB
MEEFQIQSTKHQDSLLEALVLYTKLYHKPFSAEALLAGLPIESSADSGLLFSTKNSKSLFSRAAGQAGLKTTLIKKSLPEMLNLHLPVILLLSEGNTCILESFNDDKSQAKIIHPSDDGIGEWVDTGALESEYLGFAFLLKKSEPISREAKSLGISLGHWFWSTLGLSKAFYRDAFLISILVNLFVLATPLFVMNVYDRVVPNNAMETLAMLAVGIVIIFIFDAILKFMRTYFLEIAAKKSDVIMSSIIFEKVMDLNMSHLPQSVGSFASNIKDFDAIRGFFASATMVVLIDFPFMILFFAVIFYVGGLLALVPITTIALVLIYALIIKNPLHKSIEATHEAAARKNGILIQALNNIETIKTQGMTGSTQWDWEEATGEIAQKGLRSKLISSSIPTVTNLLIQLNTVGIICFGVFMIYKFELTMGALIAVMMLSSRAIAPMGQFAALLTNYEDTKASYEMINEIIKKPQERPKGVEFVKRPSLKGNIEFRNVTFAYPDTDFAVIKDVSFTIKEGEKVAIIGKIGSGKSTILKLLLKLYTPTSGSILIDGIDIGQIDPADLRKSIGYQPQDIHLFKGTIKSNIVGSQAYVDDAWMLECSKKSTVDEFVSLHPLGYDMPIGERGAGLSGGQRQSVGLARALMSGADILLFDEPTNGMDQTTESQVLKNLNPVIEPKTLLLITQKMNMLALTHRVIIMHNGKVIKDGKKEDVMKGLGRRDG